METREARITAAIAALQAAGLSGTPEQLRHIAYPIANGPASGYALDALARIAQARRPRPAPAAPRPAPVAPRPASAAPAAPSPAELARQAQLAETRRLNAILALTPTGRAALAARKRA